VGTHSPEQGALLTDYDTNSAYSRAYYTVYTNIRFDWNSEQSRQHAILLAAPDSFPGQAIAAANVAIAAAQSGTPTILVDADLATPGLDQRFGLEARAGLSELLTGQSITSQAVSECLSETFVPGLRLLGMGKKIIQAYEMSRLLGGKLSDVLAGTRQYLAASESKPGLIIFSSPAVLASIDASQISAVVDQTFLLIAAGHTTRTQARKAQEQLQRAHAQLAGIILLNV